MNAAQPPPSTPAVCAVVALGGVLGSLGRWAVGLALPHPPSGVAWATLCVNVSGALLAGLVVTVVVARGTHPLVRPFAVVGVLGGWTTYSALMLDTLSLARTGHALLALAYLTSTLVLGLLAVALGVTLARLVVGRPREGA